MRNSARRMGYGLVGGVRGVAFAAGRFVKQSWNMAFLEGRLANVGHGSEGLGRQGAYTSLRVRALSNHLLTLAYSICSSGI